ncbi:hypothetical protein OF83DRAFT_130299 [Amylostereum chailletii]|nr:hypothetical protein OF83DRAFT_130299 [Amylostereum chailletii]
MFDSEPTKTRQQSSLRRLPHYPFQRKHGGYNIAPRQVFSTTPCKPRAQTRARRMRDLRRHPQTRQTSPVVQGEPSKTAGRSLCVRRCYD